MMLDQRPYTFDRVFRLGVTVVTLVVLGTLLGYLSDVLIPFAFALVLAYLMDPLVRRIQRRVRSRLAAVLISLAALVLVLALAAAIVVPAIMSEVRHIGELVSGMTQSSDIQQRIAERLPPDIWQAVKDFLTQETVQGFFRSESFWKLARDVLSSALPGTWRVMRGLASLALGLLGLATICLYLVFLLLDFQRVREGWEGLIPPAWRPFVVEFARETQAAMRRHFRNQAAIAAIVGVLFATGFAFIGLPLGILLGLFIGLLNMVPYLQTIGLLPAALLAFVRALETGGGFWMIMLQVLIVFVVVQVLQEVVLTPKIMGRATGLSPAVILLSLSVWGKLLGVLGLLVAIPATCVLLAYYRRLLAGQASPAAVPSEPPPAGGPPK